MSKIAVVLSVLALGGSGYTAWKTGVLPCMGCCTGSCPTGRGDRTESDEIAVLSQRLAALDERLSANAAPTQLPAPKTPTADDATLASAPKPLAVPPSLTATSTATLAALESRLASLEEGLRSQPQLAELRHTAELQGSHNFPSSIAFASPTFYSSVDGAAKDLDLSPRQKDDFERAVADSRRDMDELKKIPDSDGKTWEDIEKGALPKAGEGLGSIDLGAILGFPSRKIPGRTETFGQAQKRIQDAAKGRMRDTLTPDQQKKFAKANVDPLIGGSSGAMFSFDFATGTSDDPAMK